MTRSLLSAWLGRAQSSSSPSRRGIGYEAIGFSGEKVTQSPVMFFHWLSSDNAGLDKQHCCGGTALNYLVMLRYTTIRGKGDVICHAKCQCEKYMVRRTRHVKESCVGRRRVVRKAAWTLWSYHSTCLRKWRHEIEKQTYKTLYSVVRQVCDSPTYAPFTDNRSLKFSPPMCCWTGTMVEKMDGERTSRGYCEGNETSQAGNGGSLWQGESYKEKERSVGTLPSAAAI